MAINRQSLAERRTRCRVPIGSGLVEGACKTVLGRRLKTHSARWRPERADHVAALCCLLYSDPWDRFRQNRAA